jgi:hypothetical protein
MLTLDDAIDRIAAAVLRDHAAELASVYRKYPTRTNQPRKTLCNLLAHAIDVKITQELKGVRAEGVYPPSVENMPAITRARQRVFEGILRSNQGQ